MNNQRPDKFSRNKSLIGWWNRLLGRVETPEIEKNRLTGLNKSGLYEEQTMFCQHARITRFAASTFKTILRFRKNRFLSKGCPLCGLPVPGDRAMEFVLKIWFIDGDGYEYSFRNRPEEECYSISDNVLKVFFKNAVVCYPLAVIGTIEFKARSISSRSPEVAEAERIIATLNDFD